MFLLVLLAYLLSFYLVIHTTNFKWQAKGKGGNTHNTIQWKYFSKQGIKSSKIRGKIISLGLSVNMASNK